MGVDKQVIGHYHVVIKSIDAFAGQGRGKEVRHDTMTTILNTNRMGSTQKVGAGKDAPVVKLTPAATRMLLTVPAKDRDKILLKAEAIRIEQGHPTSAGKTTTKVWDQHLAQALGAENTPEAIAELRKERDLPRPAVV